MSQINSYFVGQNDNKVRLLIELLDKDSKNLSTFYYELILKINGGKLDKKYYEIESVNEIYDIFPYLYSNFKGNIKKRKLDDITNDYLIKILNFQTYKKGFNERLVRRLSAYEEALKSEEEKKPNM